MSKNKRFEIAVKLAFCIKRNASEEKQKTGSLKNIQGYHFTRAGGGEAVAPNVTELQIPSCAPIGDTG